MHHILFSLTAALAATGISLSSSMACQEHAQAAGAPISMAAPVILAASSGHDHAGSGAPKAVAAGDLEITAAWARAMLPGQPAGGGYLSITNKGAVADRLTGVSSPVSGKVEVHEMKVENDVMVMRPVSGGVEIPAGAVVELKPGGHHLMFMQVQQPFAEGGEVPVTLEFEKAGKVDVTLPVRKAGGDDHSSH